MYHVHVVDNGVQAKEKTEQLAASGFTKEQIYVFTHEKNHSDNLTDALGTGEVGIQEQGIFESIGNLFKSRGDELRSKMQSLGLSEVEADQYEEQLDNHKVVVIASNEGSDKDNTKTEPYPPRL